MLFLEGLEQRRYLFQASTFCSAMLCLSIALSCLSSLLNAKYIDCHFCPLTLLKPK